jgi:hypothetical protein
MSNSYALINCEGNILVFFFEKNKITAQALLDDGTGKVFFEIKKFEIKKYLHSDLKLDELLQKSSITNVEIYDYQTKLKSIICKKNIGKLACGDSYFNDIPYEMKLCFRKRIELSIRISNIALNFEKIMELILHYYFLKEKSKFLYFTFGAKNPITMQNQKQLDDVGSCLIEMEIPFEFVCYDEIKKLNIAKACLKEDCNIEINKIAGKNIYDLTNKEMNYLVYQLSNILINLNKYPRFWTKNNKNEYLKEYKDHYYKFRRNILIDDILK